MNTELNELKVELSMHFPTKEIRMFRASQKELEEKVIYFAKKYNKTIFQFLYHMGFVYDRNHNIEALEYFSLQELESKFPEKTIDISLSTENRPLYTKLLKLSKYNSATLSVYLKSNGFELDSVYRERPLISKFTLDEEDLKRELFKHYPSGKVSSLTYLTHTLECEVKRIATLKKMDIFDFITSLGFEYNPYNSDKAKEHYALKKLHELFPDQKITYSLSKEKPALYSKILKLSSTNGLTFYEYLSSKGFVKTFGRIPVQIPNKRVGEYVTMDDIFIASLINLYPNKVVSLLTKTDKRLYNKLSYHAKKRNTTVPNLVNSLGFTWETHVAVRNVQKPIPKNLESLTQRYVDKLIEFYPDKNIVSFHKNHKTLYNKICNICKFTDDSLHSWLEKFGFSYKSGKSSYKKNSKMISPRSQKTLDSLKAKVQSVLDDAGVVSPKSLGTNLYACLVYHAKKQGMSMSQFISFLGFKYTLNSSASIQPTNNKNVIGSHELHALKSELNKVAVDGTIYSTSLTNTLLKKLRACNSKTDMSFKSFLNFLGFEYVKNNRKTKNNGEN